MIALPPLLLTIFIQNVLACITICFCKKGQITGRPKPKVHIHRETCNYVNNKTTTVNKNKSRRELITFILKVVFIVVIRQWMSTYFTIIISCTFLKQITMTIVSPCDIVTFRKLLCRHYCLLDVILKMLNSLERKYT